MKRFILKGIVIAMVALALFGAVVMLLWNSVVVNVFGLNVITYWQALGLLALCRLLFGSFGGGGRRGGKRFEGNCHEHKHRLRKKLMKMSPEEREAYIKKIKQHRVSIHEHCHNVYMYGRRGYNTDNNNENQNPDKA